jgi:hypothetical protein
MESTSPSTFIEIFQEVGLWPLIIWHEMPLMMSVYAHSFFVYMAIINTNSADRMNV